jgi:hypothetical protein
VERIGATTPDRDRAIQRGAGDCCSRKATTGRDPVYEVTWVVLLGDCRVVSLHRRSLVSVRSNETPDGEAPRSRSLREMRWL